MPRTRASGQFRCFARRTFRSDNSKITQYFYEPADSLQFEAIGQSEEFFNFGELAGEIANRDPACRLDVFSLVNFGDSENGVVSTAQSD
jgi:hypothetical protein